MIQERRKRVRTMDQRSASGKNSTLIQGSAVRACELRLERLTFTADGTERVEFLCGASGGPEHGYVLGVTGGDLSSMVATCNACPIPDALEARSSCRWFYTLYGQNQPRDTTVCQSCPYWFPRPPRELIPNYWPETQKMLRVVNGEESTSGPPTGFTPAARQPPKTWWQRLRQMIHL